MKTINRQSVRTTINIMRIVTQCAWFTLQVMVILGVILFFFTIVSKPSIYLKPLITQVSNKYHLKITNIDLEFLDHKTVFIKHIDISHPRFNQVGIISLRNITLHWKELNLPNWAKSFDIYTWLNDALTSFRISGNIEIGAYQFSLNETSVTLGKMNQCTIAIKPNIDITHGTSGNVTLAGKTIIHPLSHTSKISSQPDGVKFTFNCRNTSKWVFTATRPFILRNGQRSLDILIKQFTLQKMQQSLDYTLSYHSPNTRLSRFTVNGSLKHNVREKNILGEITTSTGDRMSFQTRKNNKQLILQMQSRDFDKIPSKITLTDYSEQQLNLYQGNFYLKITLPLTHPLHGSTWQLRMNGLSFSYAKWNVESLQSHISSNNVEPSKLQAKTVETPLGELKNTLILVETKPELMISHATTSIFSGNLALSAPVYLHKNQTVKFTYSHINLASISNWVAHPSLQLTGQVAGNLALDYKPYTLPVLSTASTHATKPGIINYHSTNFRPTQALSATQLQFAMKAAENFHFTTLRAKMSKTGNNDLHLQLNMKGKNPDLYEGQPITLNINLDGPILALLSQNFHRLPTPMQTKP